MDDKIERVQRAVDEVAEKVEDRSLAMEMLQELKATVKRLWIVVLILIAVIVGQFCLYTYERLQWDYSSTTIEATQDGEGTNIVGGGDVNYGAESQGNNQS